MAKKDELRKLGREELLTLLLAVEEENESLKKHLAELQAKLDDKMIRIEKSGNLADAVLELNGVIASVNDACEQYAMNMRKRSDAELEKSRRMVRETEDECRRMEWETVERCRQMEREAEEKVRRILREKAE